MNTEIIPLIIECLRTKQINKIMVELDFAIKDNKEDEFLMYASIVHKKTEIIANFRKGLYNFKISDKNNEPLSCTIALNDIIEYIHNKNNPEVQFQLLIQYNQVQVYAIELISTIYEELNIDTQKIIDVNLANYYCAITLPQYWKMKNENTNVSS